MKTVCDMGLCTGCKACINACTQQAISYIDLIDHVGCIVDEDRCHKCGKCFRVCPNNSNVEKKAPQSYVQAWAPDSIRSMSASGGAASAIMEGFVKKGGFVCSCTFEAGEFIFKSTNNIAEIKQFAGSKYVKSDAQKAYAIIGQLLGEGKKVLFVGLPCQSAGVLNYFRNDENLFTIDLICHGTPSPLLLKKYLAESNIDLSSIKEIKFRDKDVYGICIDKKKLLPKRVRDCYLSSFLNAVCYTDNCYACKYATFDRVSDLTLGDAWGQMSETTKEGVSLILCQSQKGSQLLEMAELEKHDVDIEKAVAANPQLRRPSYKQPNREKFMKAVKDGRSFRHAYFLSKPKDSIKECIKFGLIKIGLLSDK